MQIDIVSPAELADEDVTAWAALQQADPAFRSPFLSPYWAQAVAEVDGPDRRGGRVVILSEDGVAKGFMAARAGRFTALPIGAPMCDYQALVSARSLRINPERIVRALGVSRFDFHTLLSDQPVFAPYMRGFSEGQVVDFSDGYEPYEAGRKAAGSGVFKDTAKKGRKQAAEVGEAVFTPLSASQDDFDQLIAWKRKQYRATRQTDIFEAGWTLDLVRRMFRRTGPGFGGALFTLHVGGQLAAAHFAFRGPDQLHAWFIAHDDNLARYSPGVALIIEILKWGAANGFRELDFGAGEQRFKLQLANRQRKVAHGFVGRPGPASLVRAAEYGLRQAAEALPLGRASALPGKAMRRLDLLRALT
jgi:CelD/BcsL family acetyltransferase involved in cellulose biosynthesis